MRQEKKRNTVVFDMDGVILDSENAVLEQWQEIAKEIDLPDLKNVYISCCGTTRTATEAIMKAAYGEAFPFDELDKRAYHMRDVRYRDGLPLKPGIRELLDALRAHDIRTALATSTGGERARWQLQQVDLLDYFDVQVTGDMVTRSKPDPEIFLKAIALSGTDPEHTIIIEDSFNGVRAARRAGAEVIMVPDLRQPDDEIAGQYDHVFASLHEVREYILEHYI